MHTLQHPHRYTGTAIALHWIVAGLIAGAFGLGLIAVELAVSPQKLRLYSWHKWIGVSLAMLAVVRIAWRLWHPAPALPSGMRRWEQLVATATHTLLYTLLLALPVTGWLMSSASGFPVVYFGVLALPDLVAKDKALADSLKLLHYALNKTLLLLIVLHVTAALKHHVIDRDNVLLRMLPFLKPRAPRRET
jgi:cytochrome b561